MPFAKKFWAMMGLPFPGDTLGEMVVEEITVGHQGRGAGRYDYPVRIVVCGVGGQAGVKRALKPLLASHVMTFSGFGTPYQLWFDSPEIEPLGEKRYAVTVEGAGARLWLADYLARFWDHLAAQGLLAPPEGDEGAALDDAARDAVIEDYLAEYQKEVARLAGRYRRKIARQQEQQAQRS